MIGRICVLFCSFFIAGFSFAEHYTVLVAGHAYGSYYAHYTGLYPEVFRTISRIKAHEDVDFIVFSGDFVRSCTRAALDSFMLDMRVLDTHFKLVLGNHDYGDICREKMNQLYGDTYYTLRHKKDIYFFFDTQKEACRLPEEQLRLLQNTIEQEKASRNVFIFMHEVLAFQDTSRFIGLRGNSSTERCKQVQTNYYDTFLPLLKAHSENKYYVIFGDVGHGDNAISALYDESENNTTIASGMGDHIKENILKIQSFGVGHVLFDFIPLNDTVSMPKAEKIGLDYYTDNDSLSVSKSLHQYTQCLTEKRVMHALSLIHI